MSEGGIGGMPPIPPSLISPLINLSSTVSSLKNREQSQDEEEQVQYADEDRDGQQNGVWHRVCHVFGALHIVQDIAREDSNTQNRDEQLYEGRVEEPLEEDASNTQHDYHDQANEEVS